MKAEKIKDYTLINSIIIIFLTLPLNSNSQPKNNGSAVSVDKKCWCYAQNKIFPSTQQECNSKKGLKFLLKSKAEEYKSKFEEASLLYKKDKSKASQLLEELLIMRSDDYRVYKILFFIYIDNNPLDVEYYLDKLFILKDNDYSVHDKYADYILSGKDLTHYQLSVAKKHYKRALEINEKVATTNIKYARLLFKLGEYTNAERYFRKGLLLNNKDANAHFDFAHFLFETGKLFPNDKKIKEAKRHFDKAFELGKNDANLLSRYADILQKNGEFSDSIDFYKRSMNLEPNNPATYYQYAAVLESCLKEKCDPNFYYLIALKLDKKNAKAHYYYANYLSELNPEKAYSNYVQALQLDNSLLDNSKFDIDISYFLEKNPKFYNEKSKYTFRKFIIIPSKYSGIKDKIRCLNDLKSFIKTYNHKDKISLPYNPELFHLNIDKIKNWRGKVADWPHSYLFLDIFEGTSFVSSDPENIQIINANDLVYMMLCSRYNTFIPNSYFEFKKSNINHLKWVNISKKDINNPYPFEHMSYDSLILFYHMDFDSSFFNDSYFINGCFIKSKLNNCTFDNSLLWWANFHDSWLINASFKNAQLIGTNLTGADLYNADMDGCIFELEKDKFPKIERFAYAKNLDKMRYKEYPGSLVNLRKAFEDAGFNYQAKQITCAIKTTERKNKFSSKNPLDWVIGLAYILFMELPCCYGSAPFRTLLIIFFIFVVSSFIYGIFLKHQSKKKEKLDGIWKIWPEDRVRQDLGEKKPVLLQVKKFKLIGFALYFSLLSAFNIGWREINIGNWISRIQRQEYTFKATGFARTIAGIQSLLSVYLLVLFILCYFGDPFKW